jgi:hypothetical protein
MTVDDQQFAATHIGLEAAGGIGQEQSGCPERREQFHAPSQSLSFKSLVGVNASLQRHNWAAAEGAAGDPAGMARRGGGLQPARRPSLDQAQVFQALHQPTEAGAEHHSQPARPTAGRHHACCGRHGLGAHAAFF